MKARVKWVEQVSFLGETESSHAVLMDGSPAAGGRNLGPRPMEMLLLGAGGEGLSEQGVHVLDVEEQRDCGAAQGLRAARAHLGELVGQHDRRVADLDLSVADAAVRRGHAHQLGRAKRLLVEIEGLRGALDDQVRRQGVIAVGDGFNRHVVFPPLECNHFAADQRGPRQSYFSCLRLASVT